MTDQYKLKRAVRDPKFRGSVTGTACVVCGKPGDCAHIKSKGAGGDDTPENLMPLCRWHHRNQHSWGWPKFCETFPQVETELHKRGWRIVLEFGVCRLRRA